METLTRPVTYEDALGLLKTAVQSKPSDYVYRRENEACRYWSEGEYPEPMCIVGHVFAQLGYGVDHEVEGCVDEALETMGVIHAYDDEARNLLQLAQHWQDGTTATWAEAVHAAERGYEPKWCAIVADPRLVLPSTLTSQDSAALAWVNEHGIRNWTDETAVG